MSVPPLIQLSDAALTWGGAPVFDAVSLTIGAADRLALVGRNGSGKSTLMKAMAGLVEIDSGEVVRPPGTSVGYLAQDPDMSGFSTLGDWAADGVGLENLWRVEAVAEGLRLDLGRSVAEASGGELRRVALARALSGDADLLLLDEPTNHLDIEAIEWLESHLLDRRGAFVVISHDRTLLRAVSSGTLWIDRGRVRRLDRGFDAFEDWRDTTWAEEDASRHKLDRKIAEEARWAVEGISARRKRNQGRLRALDALKAERAGQIRREGRAALALESGSVSGRRVIEARGLTIARGGKPICRNFDIRIARGERIAYVGPNGVGKTTLIEALTGRLVPDAGSVELGTNVEMAVFDQRRAALDPDATLWDSLTGDPEMRVGGRADQVMVRGTPRHVVGYLKDFLFDEAQARGPVRALSGGEKARLLLARLMAKPSNLLVLDEPTNDLDVETLDLLQDILAEYEGTVLLVSHDRDFLDRVATRTVAMEGRGQVTIHAGGWSDYAPRRKLVETPLVTRTSQPKPRPKPKPAARPAGLSFTERHRLDALPAEIARLEAEIARLETLLSDPELYGREPTKFAKATEALAERQARLLAAENDWLALEEKAQSDG